VSTIAVIVNDQPRSIAADWTVQSLAQSLGLAEKKGVALALNGSVAPRQKWSSQPLQAGDRVIIIQATQGG
jgi:sulfur carrier protein